jgi:hypothetical protein
MLDGYSEVFAMAQKLGLPQQPLWYDLHGCPRWERPEKKLEKFVKGIRCQACGQKFRVCLVDGIYRKYGHGIYESIHFSGSLPRNWHYGDAPQHPTPDKWGKDWWEGGWDAHCVGETMNSIPEPEWECWDFKGKMPMYRKKFLVVKEKD